MTDEYANDNSNKLKLKLIQGDDIAYDALISQNKPIENTNITSNYNYFYSEIEKVSPDELEGIYSAISKLDIVSISLQPQNGDDPQLIFESLNSTGLDLETADKIRNYVLMNMKHREQEKFYKNYWKPLEQTVGHREINKFIRYYLANKTRKLYDEKKVYFEFKYYGEDSKRSMESIFQEMLEYADYYSYIVNPEKKQTPYSDILERINKLDVKTCIPLIMDVFKAESGGYISKENMKKALEIIENFIIRREICDLPTNAITKMFVQIGAEVDRDISDNNISYYDAFCGELLSKTGKSKFPNNHEFRDHFETYDLYGAKTGMRKYILERLENFENKERVDVEQLVDAKTLPIEHIMPQTLSDEWKHQLGKNFELIWSKYLNTPGNLTLTAYNSNYSNSSFRKKKEMPEKGLLFSKLYLNEYLKTCNDWGESQIRKRASILYEKAERIWWIPENTTNTMHETQEWINWNEDVDITGKQVVQVEIMGTLIKTKDMSDAYKKIHMTLFDFEPSAYYDTEFSWFGKTQRGMRNPFQLNDEAYIETNLNNNNKLKSIQKIADSMQLDFNDVRLLITNKVSKAIFKIEDESTYGSLKVGKLAFEFFRDLMNKGKISADEVKRLKTKDCTKKIFNKTVYPALADQRDANRGNSDHIRYRKDPLIFEGNEIYVTTQFFEEERDALVRWYKKHLME